MIGAAAAAGRHPKAARPHLACSTAAPDGCSACRRPLPPPWSHCSACRRPGAAAPVTLVTDGCSASRVQQHTSTLHLTTRFDHKRFDHRYDQCGGSGGGEGVACSAARSTARPTAGSTLDSQPAAGVASSTARSTACPALPSTAHPTARPTLDSQPAAGGQIDTGLKNANERAHPVVKSMVKKTPKGALPQTLKRAQVLKSVVQHAVKTFLRSKPCLNHPVVRSVVKACFQSMWPTPLSNHSEAHPAVKPFRSPRHHQMVLGDVCACV